MLNAFKGQISSLMIVCRWTLGGPLSIGAVQYLRAHQAIRPAQETTSEGHQVRNRIVDYGRRATAGSGRYSYLSR